MKKPTLVDFKTSISGKEIPAQLSVHGQALWWAAKGDWEKAHDLIQDQRDLASARIHAYLHRLEGDISNAGYWYAKANSKMPPEDLDQEWEQLVNRYVT